VTLLDVIAAQFICLIRIWALCCYKRGKRPKLRYLQRYEVCLWASVGRNPWTQFLLARR